MKRSARILGVEIADDAAEEIAGRARGTPRIANRILRRVRDVAQVRHQGSISTADRARGARSRSRSTRPGSSAIRPRAPAHDRREVRRRARLALDARSFARRGADTIEDVYEPSLLQLGYIQRTPRGRTITKLGRAHVGAAPRENELF